MQLNHDCIRDVLLYLEDHTGIYQEEHSKKFLRFEVGTNQLCKDNQLDYEPDMIVYTVLKLVEAGMLDGHETSGGDKAFYGIVITDITWEGHEFLGNIRDDTTWNRVKESATKLGVSSVKGVATLAWQLFLASFSNPGAIQGAMKILQNI